MPRELSCHFNCFQSDVTYFACRQIRCPCAQSWYDKLFLSPLIQVNYDIATASLPTVSFTTIWTLIYPSISVFKSKVQRIQACFHLCKAKPSWSSRCNFLPSQHGVLWLLLFSLFTSANGSFPMKNIHRAFSVAPRPMSRSSQRLHIYLWWDYCVSITKLSKNLIWSFGC